MSLTKARLKILEKIAQQTGTAPVSPTDPSNTTPSTTVPTAVPQAPTIRASEIYPAIRNGFDAARVAIIDQLVNELNIATNIATSGKYNLQVLRNQNFAFDPSSFPSPDQKNILGFFLKVYITLLNRGQPFAKPVEAQDLNRIIQFLLLSPELANLSQINPTGPISQKIPGNFKNNVRELIARLQPTVTTRRA